MSQTTVVTTAPEPKLWGGGRSPFNVSYGKMMIWFFLLSDALTSELFLSHTEQQGSSVLYGLTPTKCLVIPIHRRAQPATVVCESYDLYPHHE
jgi:hypothetical protein